MSRLVRRMLRAMPALLLLVIGVACGTASGTSAEAAGALVRDAGGAQATTTPRAKPTAERPRRAEGTAVTKDAAGREAAGRDVADDVDREHFARAGWAPGQLEAHFDKHGQEGPYRTQREYDAAARETIRRGASLTYVDRESDAPRVGFYERAANRFTGLTRDGGRITTHFRPDRGEGYVRGLERSTYR